jgi:hypothetical protein
MRVVAVAIVALAIYFAASLLWPAHDRSVVQGAVPQREAAHGGTYARDLLARAAPRDADAYAAAVTQLAALGEDDASAALGAWMESHVWRRLLGQADAVPATVADAIAAGRGVAPALADLRAQVLAKSLRLEVDETADAASAAAAHDERMPPDAVAPAAVAPGLWSHRRPRGDYEMRLALRVTNTAGTPIGPFRLVVAWNGHDDQRLACERRAAGTAAIAPDGAATAWCRDLGGDGRQLPVSDPARWRGDGSAPNRPVAIASGSTLDFPELDVRIPGFDQHTFFLRDLRGASMQAQGEVRRLGCAQLGDCLRAPFKPQAIDVALLAWAVSMVFLVVAAFSYRRHRAFALVLALFSCWIALGRTTLAWRGDAYFSSSAGGASLWLLLGAAAAFLAWSLRAPVADRALAPAMPGASGPPPPRVGTATIVGRALLAIVAIGVIFAALAFGAILYGLSHWRG